MLAMISRLEGELVALTGDRAQLRSGPITYEVLIPAADQQRLASQLRETVSLHTLHFLEGQGQGSSFVPRLIGFTTVRDRSFFELFTTVKGLGNRKALRALAIPFGAVAGAIAGRDVDLLKSLPEIGRRTAETIIAELHGKVDAYIELKPIAEAPPGTVVAQDAVAVLCQLGETTHTARQLVTRALAADPELDAADAVVEAALRLKEAS